MAGANKWLVGCGVGCGLVLLVIVVVIVAGTFFVRDTVKGFSEAVEIRGEIEERFGEVDAFTPWPDGVVPAERIEAFLAVREATAATRAEISRSFGEIPMSETEARELDEQSALQKLGSVFRITRSAMGLGGDIGVFFEARNRGLIDNEMGLGEYTYLYTLIYYAWLGHSPEEGPESLHEDDDGAEVQMDFMSGTIDRRIHDDLLAILRNQMDALGPDVEEPWREALAAEIEALERNRGRFPWQEGLPEAIADSLEPHRSRLESAYSPATNPFELAINEKQGGFSIQAR